MSTSTEMQNLRPDHLSHQSSRTAIATDQGETRSKQLLQGILDELRSSNDASSTTGPARTSAKDFSAGQSQRSQHGLSRGISSVSLASSSSLSNSTEARFYQQLFTAVVAFSALGGSITFQCIFQEVPEATQNKHISKERARTLVAISWLLFTMDLGLSSIVLAALYVRKTTTVKEGGSQETWDQRLHRYVNISAALILPLGAVAALIFAALAVSAVSYAVGLTALVSVSVLGGAILVWWFSFCVRYFWIQKQRTSPA